MAAPRDSAMVIGGEPRPAAGDRRYEVYEAATGAVLAFVPDAAAADVDDAVRAAQSAAPAWRALGSTERASRVRLLAQAVRDNAPELAALDSRNGGMPIRGTQHGASKGADALDYFAGLALEVAGRTLPATTDHLHYTVREPFGVVGVITAFNHPTLFATARTAAALVTGNCVILKPAVQTPLSSLRVAVLARDIFPPGVFNVVTGAGATGSALVRHPGVPRIGFTGSVATALRIQHDAAQSGTIKRLSFELGGKNPLVVLPDVAATVAADAAVEGMNLFKVLGQSCGSTSRAFIHRDVYEDFVAAVTDRFDRLELGDPLEPATDLGPLVSAAQRDRVEQYVAIGLEEGATVTVGGSRPTKAPFDRGFYYPPTVFRDGTPEMRIAREEIFGPVLTVIPWDDEATMLRAVNDSSYGLTASIYTNDLRTAHRLAAEIDAGYVWVNDVEKRWIGIPFGGHKNSGTSVEYSIDELFANTQNKSVSIRLT
jgi:betaine-aldehyde dehydrogenase